MAPARLCSDQGWEFVNTLEDTLFSRNGTDYRVTSGYHPLTNGVTERFDQTFQATLMKLVNNSLNDSDDHLLFSLFIIQVSRRQQS